MSRIFNQLMASILVNSIYAMVNYPVVMINTLLAPLSILAVVTFASHGSLLPIGALGALIMNMVQSGISIQGDLSHLKNDMKLQDMVVSSPTSAGIYIFGMAISEIVYSIPTLTLLLILNFLFVKASLFAWFLIFIDMATIFTFSIALGFLLSTFSSDIVQSWAFAGILSPLLSTIPPVYYPITFIPLPYRYISYLSPTTYAAEIAQSLAGYVPFNIYEFIMLWIVLIGITVLIFFLALKKSRWREV
ncbi:MAG: ABC transporter permease [Thermoplasmata archaeon]|nr:ABC transporter permease [Thermoplasmata archaeon]